MMAQSLLVAAFCVGVLAQDLETHASVSADGRINADDANLLLQTRLHRPPDGNRLTYLDAVSDPYYPSLEFPKLITPQWVGEPGVQAVIVLTMDDLGLNGFTDVDRYVTELRPIMERLKKIDNLGRAPITINTIKLWDGDREGDTALWNQHSRDATTKLIKEGVNLDVHSHAHACPMIGDVRGSSNCVADARYHDCVDEMFSIEGNRPTGFRYPCCDSMPVVSPRFYAELASQRSTKGNSLKVDSSIFNLATSSDRSLPLHLTTLGDGTPRYSRYSRNISQEHEWHLGNTVTNYPYPYIIYPGTWELPIAVPSDYQGRGQSFEQALPPAAVEDMKISLDVVVQKQGIFTLTFHMGSSEAVVDLIDYAVSRYGRKVKFLSFHDVAERLDKHLLLGQSLRTSAGGDNGVHLLDLNGDGFLDVLIGNSNVKLTRIWRPFHSRWQDGPLPVDLRRPLTQFGILHSHIVMLQLSDNHAHLGWRWSGDSWQPDADLVNGLEGIRTVIASGKDAGLRLRDIDNDGNCEVIVANGTHQELLRWSESDTFWSASSLHWPKDIKIVDGHGQDAGLRFVDLNKDGFDDVVFSNVDRSSISLWNKGKGDGWSVEVFATHRGGHRAISSDREYCWCAQWCLVSQR